MQVIFKEKNHLYESIPAIPWTSVTKVVSKFCPVFDERKQAVLSSQNEKSKWYRMGPEEIINIWAIERERSTETGTWYHNKMEKLAISKGTKVHRGNIIPVFSPLYENNIKYAPAQELIPGVYPEHFIYNEAIGICGQSDLVFVSDGFVDISDYKTNKKMELHEYGYRYGNPRMMFPPVHKLEDCNYYHYALQLSIYMYLILAKNKHLKPGKLELIHINFKIASYDKYGFPIHTKDGDDFIVEKITKYEVPYLKKEAEAVLKELYKRNKSITTDKA